MQIVMATIMGIFAVFMLQSLGRTIYIDRYEFRPAALEWKAAKERGDQDGMKAAFEKERRANQRTIDPFWFLTK